MPIQILPPSDETVTALREAIAKAIPDGDIDVRAQNPGHFEITVVSPAFEGKTRVRQQQLVYGAIAHLMHGEGAPVHAVDRMFTKAP